MKANAKNPSIRKGESTATGKVGTEIEPLEKNSDDSSDNLGVDELAAFEKIMGEIKGQEDDKLNGTAIGSGTEAKDEQELDEKELSTLNDVIEAMDTENNVGADIPDSTSAEVPLSEGGGDENLDEDQQKAFESIMAQIEAGNTEEAGSDSEKSASIDPKPEEAPEDQKETAVGPTIEETDADTQDISDDIEDILIEITPNDDESPLSETAVDQPVSEPSNVDALEKTIVDDDIVAQIKEDRGPKYEDSSQTSPPDGNNGEPTESEEKPSVKDRSGHKLTEIKPTSASLLTHEKAKGLRDATQSTGGRKKKAVMALAVTILFFALAGYFYWAPKSIFDSKTPPPDTDTRPPDGVIEKQPPSRPQEPVAVLQGPSDPSRLKTAAENLDRLRNELIEKQAEIEELRAYYQAGIDAEIQGIVALVRKTGKGTIPFEAAIADPHISLGLSAIQRRDTYIKKLVTPAKALFWNSEELLFFSRKAGMLALMAGKTSDIGVDEFIKQADEILDVHGRALAQLNIDAVPASPLALESIWQDIDQRLTTTPVKPENDHTATKTDDAVIWENICNGDFTLKHKLTALSPKAARCLATWKGKDLFLNALTDLSPKAARHLATWEGDWLGLNNLKELSPEAAEHLSQWKGKGLSLNGLSHLSPRLVAILSEWQGDRLELVNVKHMAHWENPKTRLFLSENLKRKHNATRK